MGDFLGRGRRAIGRTGLATLLRASPWQETSLVLDAWASSPAQSTAVRDAARRNQPPAWIPWGSSRIARVPSSATRMGAAYRGTPEDLFEDPRDADSRSLSCSRFNRSPARRSSSLARVSADEAASSRLFVEPSGSAAGLGADSATPRGVAPPNTRAIAPSRFSSIAIRSPNPTITRLSSGSCHFSAAIYSGSTYTKERSMGMTSRLPRMT